MIHKEDKNRNSCVLLILSLTGSCTSCKPEFLRSETLSVNYPSAPSSITPTDNSVEAVVEVSNDGDTPQKPSVAFKFTTTVTTTMKLTNTSETSSKVSLGLSVPQIGANFKVDKGSTNQWVNGESNQQSTTVSVKYSLNANVEPHTLLRVTGQIHTKTVQIRVPVTYRVYETCGNSYDVQDTAVLTSSGVVTSTDSDLRVRYDSQPL